MALSPYEEAVRKAKAEKMRVERHPKKDPILVDAERRLEVIRREARGKETSTQQNQAGSEYLQECLNCHHRYSKRADKCPKCGNVVHVECNICKRKIPKNSTSCPECGDPEPFGSMITSHYNFNANQLTSIQGKTVFISNYRMNPYLRWSIIIGGTFLTMVILSTIKVMTGYRIGLLVMGGAPSVVFFILYSVTRPKIKNLSTVTDQAISEENKSTLTRPSSDVKTDNVTYATQGCLLILLSCIAISVIASIFS